MKILFVLSLLYISIFSKLQSTTTWDATSLYNYVYEKVKNGTENVNYMIIDPNEILNTTEKIAIHNKMESFFYSKKNLQIT